MKRGEPWRESRLPAALSGAVLGPLGVLIVGICLHDRKIWAGLTICWAMLSIVLISIASAGLTYSIDCFPSRAVDIGVVDNAVTNIIAFGVGYGVQDWLEAVGPEAQFSTMAGILWFVL